MCDLSRAVAAFVFLLDVADSALDLDLGSNMIQKGHEAWGCVLVVQAAIATLASFTVKYRLRKNKHELKEDTYSFTFALCEVMIFLIEDATTLMAWYHTGLYDNTGLSLANLVTTCVSVGIFIIGLVYNILTRTLDYSDPADVGAFPFAFFIVVWGVFWFWFALDVVADGTNEGNATNEHYTPASWFMYVMGCLVGYQSMLQSLEWSNYNDKE